MVPMVRKQREMDAGTQLAYPSPSEWVFPPQLNLLETSTENTSRGVSRSTLNPIKVTVKLSHHRPRVSALVALRVVVCESASHLYLLMPLNYCILPKSNSVLYEDS